LKLKLRSGMQQPCHCSSEENHKRCKEYTRIMEGEVKNVVRDVLITLRYKDDVILKSFYE